jgi:hypothetical protein
MMDGAKYEAYRAVRRAIAEVDDDASPAWDLAWAAIRDLESHDREAAETLARHLRAAGRYHATQQPG